MNSLELQTIYVLLKFEFLSKSWFTLGMIASQLRVGSHVSSSQTHQAPGDLCVCPCGPSVSSGELTPHLTSHAFLTFPSFLAAISLPTSQATESAFTQIIID